MKKYVNNKLVDMTQEEIDEYNKNQQEKIQEEPTLEEEIKMLKECLLEMSEIVYGG